MSVTSASSSKVLESAEPPTPPPTITMRFLSVIFDIFPLNLHQRSKIMRILLDSSLAPSSIKHLISFVRDPIASNSQDASDPIHLRAPSPNTSSTLGAEAISKHRRIDMHQTRPPITPILKIGNKITTKGPIRLNAP